MAKIPVLTIDGPSGSGKGTISRAVAERLGWHYLDSGAIYRAVGLAAAWEGVDLSDAEAVAQCAARTEIRFDTAGEGEPHVFVNGKDATRQLRTETARHIASGTPIVGYHMHMGETSGPDVAQPFAEVDGRPEGATRGQIVGTYLHGIFAGDAFRHAFLHVVDPSVNYEAGVDSALDGLAAHLARHLDLDRLLSSAAEV